MEFIDINLPYNKLNIKLLVNRSTAILKKKHLILKIENEANDRLKAKATLEKKISIKWVRKKSLKTLILIFSFIGKSLADNWALLININIVTLTLYLFVILPKSQEETKRLITISCKLQKKKLCPLQFQLLKIKNSFMQKSIILIIIPWTPIIYFFRY